MLKAIFLFYEDFSLLIYINLENVYNTYLELSCRSKDNFQYYSELIVTLLITCDFLVHN